MTAADQSPCRLCRKSMIVPSGRAQDVCPWCHAGDCRFEAGHISHSPTEVITEGMLKQHYHAVHRILPA